MSSWKIVSGNSSAQKGYSLIEVLSAIAILSAMSIVVSNYGNMFVESPNMLHGSCKSYAQSIISAVQEETYYRTVVNYIPAGGNRYVTSSGFPLDPSPPRGIEPPAWFYGNPANGNYTISAPGGAAGVTLQNFQLIQGSVRALAAIYNTTPAVRCAFGAYPQLTDVVAGQVKMSSDLSQVNPVAEISIRPFNTADNTDNCAARVDPMPVTSNIGAPTNAFAPAGVGPNDWGGLPNPAAGEEWSGGGPRPPNPPAAMASTGVGDPRLGMELTVRVSYTENGGRNVTCNASQKFSYPDDRTGPPPPTLTVDPASNPTEPATFCTLPKTAQPSIQISYPAGTNFERGTQFLCRDLSWRKNWAPNLGPSYAAAPPCVMYDGVGTHVFDAGRVMSTTALASVDVFVNGREDPTRQTFPRQNQWVPCDLLNQCGFAPTSASYNQANPNAAAPGVAHTLTLTFPTLPHGCVMNFEAVGVDTAGNTSISAVPGGQSFLEDTAPGIKAENEVKYPTCGVFCPYDPLTWTGFTSGYYTCREGGCCVGAGCTAFTGYFTTFP